MGFPAITPWLRKINSVSRFELNISRGCVLDKMTAVREEQKHKKTHWQNELKSLGIESAQDDLSSSEELENLVDGVKQSMVQDYMKAYLKEGNKCRQQPESIVNL
jgi:hypothetical protein